MYLFECKKNSVVVHLATNRTNKLVQPLYFEFIKAFFLHLHTYWGWGGANKHFRFKLGLQCYGHLEI